MVITANELLEQILDAHGGLAKWNTYRELHATFNVNGELLKVKGYGDGLANAVISLETREQRVIFPSFPGNDVSTSFTPELVTIFDRYQDIVEQLPGPLQSFKGHESSTPWNVLQLAYFSAYASWNYLTAPFNFTMPGVKLELLPPWEENGEMLQRLAVSFPYGFATHNSRQVYFFDHTGLLRRHNYFPDVLNGMPIVQVVTGYQEFSGMKFPTERKMYLLCDDGSYRTNPLLMNLRFSNITLS
jgi:hypothetical protein